MNLTDLYPAVSVIVPVYNAEQTLARCVDSILFQTFKNIEVILVNDGSTDQSLALCQAYAGQDARVRVIDRINGGVSQSRNDGIEAAQGVYLMFADSDDWLPENAVTLLTAATQSTGCQMAIGRFYRVIGENRYIKGHISLTQTMTRRQFAEYMMNAPANFYYGAMWNKLYRRDIVQRYGLRCSQALSYCEDALFNLEYLQYVDTVAAVNAPVYYYVKRKGSLVSRLPVKTVIMAKLRLFEYYKNLYEALDIYEENSLRVQSFLVSSAKDGGRMPDVRPPRAAVRKVPAPARKTASATQDAVRRLRRPPAR